MTERVYQLEDTLRKGAASHLKVRLFLLFLFDVLYMLADINFYSELTEKKALLSCSWKFTVLSQKTIVSISASQHF
jgi:hypothetical protein